MSEEEKMKMAIDLAMKNKRYWINMIKRSK